MSPAEIAAVEAARRTFDEWLESHWTIAEAAFDEAVVQPSLAEKPTVRSLESFVHDLSGTAGVVGYDFVGELAKAVARYGRTFGWQDDPKTRETLIRLWEALRNALALRKLDCKASERARIRQSVHDLLAAMPE